VQSVVTNVDVRLGVQKYKRNIKDSRHYMVCV